MSINIIPIDATQVAFEQEMDLGGTIFVMKFYYNSRYARWHCDVLDSDQNEVLTGRVINVQLDLFNRFSMGEKLPQVSMALFDMAGLQREADLDTFGKEIILAYDDGIVE